MDNQRIKDYVSAQWSAQPTGSDWDDFIDWLLDGIDVDAMERFGVDWLDDDEVAQMNEYIRSLDSM